MRMINLIIMGLYGLNLVIDLFSEEGSSFLRMMLVVLAYFDFGTFVVTVTRRLSHYLQFPIFGLPEDLKRESSSTPGTKIGGDSALSRGEGKVNSHGNHPNQKLESSLDEEKQVGKEPKQHIADYPQDYVRELEFDNDTEEGFEGKPYDPSQDLDPVESSNYRLKHQSLEKDKSFEDDEEKEGDVSYQNDFDDEI